jgi:hypothetical protein
MGATEELRMSPVVKDILALDFDGPSRVVSALPVYSSVAS